MTQLTQLQKKKIEELTEVGNKKYQEILDLKARLAKVEGTYSYTSLIVFAYVFCLYSVVFCLSFHCRHCET